MAYICKQGALINDQILETFKEPFKENPLKDDEEVRQYLVTRFSKARFLNKFFAPNREEQMKYTKEAIKHYELVLCYCAQYPKAKELIPEEYNSSLGVADLLKRQVKLQEKEKKLDDNI